MRPRFLSGFFVARRISMQFFTVEPLGPKQSLTPEGFLVCHDVPIARTGTMAYAALELPQLEAGADGIVWTERPPEVVFGVETMASFEGKPVTLEHPDVLVTPQNWNTLAMGVPQRVRRGEGEQDGLFLADLLITDAFAIQQVRAGLREVSCGYEADYQQVSPGRGVARQIVGNHIALVKRGRCGSRCSIGDRHMADNKGARNGFTDKLRKFFMTRDSEEFEKTLEEIKDEGAETPNGQHIHVHVEKPGTASPPDEIKKTTQDEPEGLEQKLLAAVEAIDQRLKAVEAKLEAKPQADEEPVEKEKRNMKDDASDQDALQSEKHTTQDSAALRDAFQEARARAEILAPGLKLPTFDAQAGARQTTDALCTLRRQALLAALQNGHADDVKTVSGGQDISKLTCDAAQAVFNAASELVKRKNQTVHPVRMTLDAALSNLNTRHAEFWANHH